MKDTPAFPSTNNVVLGDMMTGGHSGMTLRDYFAAKALQSILGIYDTNQKCPYLDMTPLQCAQSAYEVADAMLAARDA